MNKNVGMLYIRCLISDFCMGGVLLDHPQYLEGAQVMIGRFSTLYII